MYCTDFTRDTVILFAARSMRLFSYGMISIVLTLFLIGIGFSQWHIGVLFTIILFGNIFISLLLTTTADSVGRRKVLVIGSLLKVFAGIMFAFVHQYGFLILAGIIGIISPTGGEIGPFMAIEQACLTESLKDKVKIA
jgi:MFS family permease